VRLQFGDAAVLAGLVSNTLSTSRSGIPGLHWIPWLHQDSKTTDAQQTLVVLRPTLLRPPPAEFPARAIRSNNEVRGLPLDSWDDVAGMR
jgi:type II secretory pathway component GspD/PulD (secretin)